jgi:hypothetical protein
LASIIIIIVKRLKRATFDAIRQEDESAMTRVCVFINLVRETVKRKEKNVTCQGTKYYVLN